MQKPAISSPTSCHPVVVLGLDSDGFSGLSARSHFYFRNGDDLRAGAQASAARGLRPYALDHHAAETRIHLTTQLVRDRLRDAVCADTSALALLPAELYR